MSDNPENSSASVQDYPQFVRSSLYRMIYSNFFRYLPLPSDFTVIFCKILAAQPGGGGAIIDEVEITVGYAQLKIIYEHLAAFMSTYERELGVIEIPPTQRPDMAGIEHHIAMLKAAWGRT
jgi:hypothetical protein